MTGRIVDPKRVLLGLFVIGISVFAVSGVGMAQAPAFEPRDENPEDFPAGPGRDETFYACTACHNFKLVAAQGLSRERWDDPSTG